MGAIKPIAWLSTMKERGKSHLTKWGRRANCGFPLGEEMSKTWRWYIDVMKMKHRRFSHWLSPLLFVSASCTAIPLEIGKWMTSSSIKLLAWSMWKGDRTTLKTWHVSNISTVSNYIFCCRPNLWNLQHTTDVLSSTDTAAIFWLHVFLAINCSLQYINYDIRNNKCYIK